MISKTIKKILLLCKICTNNIWNIITIYLVAAFLLLGVTFNVVYPYVINSYNSNEAYIHENRLMKEIHTILNGNSNVTYFDIFPVLGGDRIIVVKYKRIDKKYKFNIGLNCKEKIYALKTSMNINVNIYYYINVLKMKI